MSNDLKEFYRAYKAWLDGGADLNHFLFKRRWGLCYNLLSFYHYSRRAHEVLEEMYGQLKAVGLSTTYPFNTGESDYFVSGVEGIQHENPLRIKWVEEHCK